MNERRVADRVSRALMIAGTTLAAVAAAAWMADALPKFPEWVLRLAVYKLTLASGAGLLIAGAVLRRSLRAARATDHVESDPTAESATQRQIDRAGAHIDFAGAHVTPVAVRPDANQSPLPPSNRHTHRQ